MRMFLNIKLNKFELSLWIFSLVVLFISYFVTKSSLINLLATTTGVTALMFLAKGEPLGQLLTIIFSILYALIAFKINYFSEVVTYLGMTLPSALIALVIWYRNPYEKSKTIVKIETLNRKQIILIILISLIILGIFYYLLKVLSTPYLLLATLSIFTSSIASLLTFFRSRYYALFYALNDLILITLWLLTTINKITFIPMVICFMVFFINDLYAFYNWKHLEKSQIMRKD